MPAGLCQNASRGLGAELKTRSEPRRGRAARGPSRCETSRCPASWLRASRVFNGLRPRPSRLTRVACARCRAGATRREGRAAQDALRPVARLPLHRIWLRSPPWHHRRSAPRGSRGWRKHGDATGQTERGLRGLREGLRHRAIREEVFAANREQVLRRSHYRGCERRRLDRMPNLPSDGSHMRPMRRRGLAVHSQFVSSP